MAPFGYAAIAFMGERRPPCFLHCLIHPLITIMVVMESRMAASHQHARTTMRAPTPAVDTTKPHQSPLQITKSWQQPAAHTHTQLWLC